MSHGKAHPLSPADVAGVLEIIAEIWRMPGKAAFDELLMEKARTLRATPTEGAPTPMIRITTALQKTA